MTKPKPKAEPAKMPGPDVHPELAIRGSFEGLPLGRVEARHDPRTLRLAKYLDDSSLPAIPEGWDYTSGVPSWPMYGNDRLGDCTIASAAHLVQAWTAAAGAPATPEEAAVLEAYITGTGTEDVGRFEVDVLNYWRKQGIAGHKIEAYAYVDPKNLAHVRAAIYLFGGLYAGIDLPKSAQGQPVWDVAGDGATGDSSPGSWGGHAVPYLGYGPDGLVTVTWGARLVLTDAFHLAYCDELYVPLSLDFLNQGKTPAGFDAVELVYDLELIGHQAAAEAPEEHDASGQHEQPQEILLEGLTDGEVDETREQVDGAAPGYYWEG